jgi:hypothetical protein
VQELQTRCCYATRELVGIKAINEIYLSNLVLNQVVFAESNVELPAWGLVATWPLLTGEGSLAILLM